MINIIISIVNKNQIDYFDKKNLINSLKQMKYKFIFILNKYKMC